MAEMKLWPIPTIWSHPSGVPGVWVTDYFDADFALPKGALIDTYKSHRVDPDAPITIPVRDKVLTPAVLDKDGKVTKPAEYVKDAGGKNVVEIVSYTDYTALVAAKAVEDAKVVDGDGKGWVK